MLLVNFWFVEISLFLSLQPSGLFYFLITHFLPLLWVLLKLMGSILFLLTLRQCLCDRVWNFWNPRYAKTLLYLLLFPRVIVFNCCLGKLLLHLDAIWIQSVEAILLRLNLRNPPSLFWRLSFCWRGERLRYFKVLVVELFGVKWHFCISCLHIR